MQAISFVASRAIVAVVVAVNAQCAVAGSIRISFNTATLASDECMYECYSRVRWFSPYL